MKRLFKNQVIQWITAAIVVVVVLNIGLFFYHKLPSGIGRTGAATNTIWNPGSVFVQGTEGYAWHKVDENGYLNSSVPLGKHVLCVGSSHTQAKEVVSTESYCSRLNVLLGGNSENVLAYNASQDGYFFPSIVKNFKGICGEFPDAEAIIIEIGSTEFTVDELNAALNQTEYKPATNGSILKQEMTVVQKAKSILTENLPLLRLAKSQMALIMRGGVLPLKED